MKNKIQIGVMGSCSDLKYSKNIEKWAEEVGYWVAKNGATLLFGAEKDFDSLSTAACRGAKKAGGLTIGMTYGDGRIVKEKSADIIIATGLVRGGGRETSLVLSCDVIITINGGSGTLTEMLVAYQAGIPIVALKGSGGWSDKMAGKYFDGRKRIEVKSANSPREAVSKAVELVNSIKNKQLLFIAATHGNEKIGVEVMRKVQKKFADVNWVVGNPKALFKKIRYIDTDLNRSAPGDISSNKYEIRRAAELFKESEPYCEVIDIHGTVANTGIFTIINKFSRENLALAVSLPIERIVIWERSDRFSSGPITNYVKTGLEIEAGPQDSFQIKKQLQEIVEKIIINGEINKVAGNVENKEFYYVTGKLMATGKAPASWREFKRVNYQGQTFYPLLINRYDGRWCYQMKKVSWSEIEVRL